MRLLRILLFTGALALLCTAVPGDGISPVSVKISEYTAPMRKCGVKLIDTLNSFVDRITGAAALREENEKLKEQLSLMGDLTRESAQASRRLIVLEEYLSISMRHDVLTLSVPGEITAFIPNDVSKRFTLDIGTGEGVSAYSPVLSSEGLSGVAESVTEKACTVIPLFDPQVSVCVYSPISGAKGVSCGSTKFAGQRLCILNCTEGIFVEDEVLYTSGEGGVFPLGIPVGIVTRGQNGELFIRPLSKYGSSTLYYAVL